MSWTAIPTIFYTPQTVTVTIASPAVFTLNNHGLVAGDQVYLSTTGALPTGLSTGTQYFVISAGLTTNNFELSATLGGSAINTSGTQSGTHTLAAECTSTRFQQFFTANLAALAPVGVYSYRHASPGTSGLQNGCWLECNGQAVSRTTYSALFSLIGTTYGSGDGSTTFNVPDAAGRHLLGTADATGHTDVNALGKTDGNSVANRTAKHHHAVTESAHGHSASGTCLNGDSHAHFSPIVETQTGVGQGDPGTSKTLVSVSSASSAGVSFTHFHSITLTVNAVSGNVTVSPGGSQPNDAPAFICAGTLFIKAL